jgi:hypothetical protein
MNASTTHSATVTYTSAGVSGRPAIDGGGMPTTPLKPCVRPRHSTARSVTTCENVSVTSAKYHDDRRSAGSAITRPLTLATAMPASAALQKLQCASTINSAVV